MEVVMRVLLRIVRLLYAAMNLAHSCELWTNMLYVHG